MLLFVIIFKNTNDGHQMECMVFVEVAMYIAALYISLSDSD